MKITAYYPGSFGEIIQGKAGNRNVLVSFPINLYSRVELFECSKNKAFYIPYYLKKSYMFMRSLLRKWGCERCYSNLALDVHSDIPRAKGMASSTADLCAVYRCMTQMFNRQYSEEELVDQCINIEPTDSIIFRKMTLFDYKNGLYKKTLGDYFKFNILVFQGQKTVDTVKFNSNNSKCLSSIEDLIGPLELAVQNRSLKQLLEISTESILRNQNRLYYNFLNEVIHISKYTGGLGIIGAHSGNVLGIVFDSMEKLKFVEKNICTNKLNIYDVCAIDKFKNYIM